MTVGTLFTAFATKWRSPRTLMAAAVAVAVTAGVSGPLTYEAYHARDLMEQERAGRAGQGGGGSDAGDDARRDGDEQGPTATFASTTTAPATTTGVAPPTTRDLPPTTAGRIVVRPPATPTTLRAGRVTTTTASVAPPTVPSSDLLILVSVSPDLDPPNALDGTQVSGQVYVWVEAAADAAVQWELDGSEIELAPDRRLNTAELPPGPHFVTATITREGRTERSGPAVFTVVR